jgi:hypothetical protein
MRNAEESAQLLDLCRGLETGEITHKFQHVVHVNAEDVESYLFRLLSRGLIYSSDGRWYIEGKGETLLWHYHEIKTSLGLEHGPDSFLQKIHGRLKIRKSKSMISR